ncbi:unnamed protein product [Clonostachys rosea]|uniref:Long chronological lifespan protein 2 n=1 Tax=Bionectria ochroleuca TaxID=29856 RepID=A0ABY6TZ23_BIOOC|nr:unnamed protein product [Clonostachys rosea]
MKFLAGILLFAAASLATAAPAPGDHDYDHYGQCQWAGERCNYSIYPALECCPHHTCYYPPGSPPGADGYCCED